MDGRYYCSYFKTHEIIMEQKKCEANIRNGKCGKVATWEVKYYFGIRYLCEKHRNKTDKTGYSQGSKKIIK